MTKRIEVEVDLPDFLDDDFISMLSMFSKEEISYLKMFIYGILFGCGRLSDEQLSALNVFNKST